MRKSWYALCAAVCVLAAVSCAKEEAKTDDVLVVYTPNSEALVKATIPTFEAKYNVKVELIQSGTGQLIKRLQTEKDAPYADVIWGGSYSTMRDNRELFQDYISKNNALVLPPYQNKTGFLTPFTLDGSCLLINTNLVKEPIDSYADLLKPEYKGKIASADPSNSSSAFAQLTNILLAMGGYEDENAWNFVKELYRNIDGKIKSSSSGVYKAVADGEMSIGLTYEDPSVSLEQSGAPVKVIFPKEGAVFLPPGTAIIKGAKHLDLAQKFVDFIISEECQQNFAETTTNRPVIRNGKTPHGMKDFSEINVIEEDMNYVYQHKKELVEKYKKIFVEVSE